MPQQRQRQETTFQVQGLKPAPARFQAMGQDPSSTVQPPTRTNAINTKTHVKAVIDAVMTSAGFGFLRKSEMISSDPAATPTTRVALTPGCQVGCMYRTRCHQVVQVVFLTVRPTSVVTPGCQIGYVDHTGCHQQVEKCQPCR
jgi:hypothetical protein